MLKRGSEGAALVGHPSTNSYLAWKARNYKRPTREWPGKGLSRYGVCDRAAPTRLYAAVFYTKKLPVNGVLLAQSLSEQAFVVRRQVNIQVHRLLRTALKGDSISR